MIHAPKGKVLKGYMVDINPFCRGQVRHVLIDEYGMVFVPGWGWGSYQASYKIVTFPEAIEQHNCPYGWDYDGWWTRNWSCEAWAWCYERKAPEFQPCYIIHEKDSDVIFAA